MKAMSEAEKLAAYAAMRETDSERKARYDRGDFGLSQDEARQLLLAVADAFEKAARERKASDREKEDR